MLILVPTIVTKLGPDWTAWVHATVDTVGNQVYVGTGICKAVAPIV